MEERKLTETQILKLCHELRNHGVDGPNTLNLHIEKRRDLDGIYILVGGYKSFDRLLIEAYDEGERLNADRRLARDARLINALPLPEPARSATELKEQSEVDRLRASLWAARTVLRLAEEALRAARCAEATPSKRGLGTQHGGRKCGRTPAAGA